MLLVCLCPYRPWAETDRGPIDLPSNLAHLSKLMQASMIEGSPLLPVAALTPSQHYIKEIC